MSGVGGERHEKQERSAAPAARSAAPKPASKPVAAPPLDPVIAPADPSLASRAGGVGIDGLMEQAEQALRAHRWFEAERLAHRALSLARRSENWEAMARIVLPLQEARRLRLDKAFDAKRITVVEDASHDGETMAPGCFLVQPPLVGSDARRLRLTALRREVSAAVLCREPLTQRKLWPLVAIGGVTIRAQVQPPKNAKKPSLDWFVGAMEALGDAAIASIDSGLDLDRQIDCVMACLDSIPDHEKLHQLLGEMCRRAAKGFERRLPPRLFGEEEDVGFDDPPAPRRRHVDDE